MGLILIPILIVLFLVGQAIGNKLGKSKQEGYSDFGIGRVLLIRIILIILVIPLAIGIFGASSVNFPSANSGFDTSISGVIFFMAPVILGLLVAGLKTLLIVAFKALKSGS